jgi:energy-converting hydrogenase Eha subunit C
MSGMRRPRASAATRKGRAYGHGQGPSQQVCMLTVALCHTCTDDMAVAVRCHVQSRAIRRLGTCPTIPASYTRSCAQNHVDNSSISKYFLYLQHLVQYAKQTHAEVECILLCAENGCFSTVLSADHYFDIAICRSLFRQCYLQITISTVLSADHYFDIAICRSLFRQCYLQITISTVLSADHYFDSAICRSLFRHCYLQITISATLTNV